MPSLPSEDRNWKEIMSDAWMQSCGVQSNHPSEEVLAAYAEGNLLDPERAACEAHLSECPDCLSSMQDLWNFKRGDVAILSAVKPPSTRPWVPVLMAASVLMAVTAVSWAVWQSRQAHQARNNLADMKNRYADARLQVAALHKELVLRLAPRPGGSYWSGTVTSETLQLPVTRGTSPLTPSASAHAENAEAILSGLEADGPARGPALIDRSSLSAILGDFSKADEYLTEAESVLGNAPEVENARAFVNLNKGTKESVETAEKILRRLIKQHPDFLPAWFNLALLLQQTGRIPESHAYWEEFIKREPRPAFRQAAQERMTGQ